MAFTKANSLTITSGAPSGNTVYEAINYTDLNMDQVVVDLNSLDKRAPEYNIIWVPASAMVGTTTNGAEGGLYEFTTADYMMAYYAFDTSTEEYVGFNVVMPENWDRGTVRAKFYWTAGTGCTAAESVEWEMGAAALTDSEDIDTMTFGTTQVIADVVLATTSLPTADMHITSATPAITVGSTPALGNMVHFKISRNVGSANDNAAGDAWLFGVAIQYRMTNTVTAWS